MSDTKTHEETTFSSEVDTSDGYQRLSRLAVWSIPLGLFSALSMVSPLLWFIPVVGVIFALAGLWVISKSNDTTGRNLALFGLGCAILFGTWGMTWTISRRIVLNQQAQQHATEWLRLMQQQEYMPAHQLTLDFYSRLADGSSLSEHYVAKDPETPVPTEPNMELAPGIESSPYQELAAFKINDLPKVLAEAEGKFEFEFVKNLSTLRKGQFDTTIDQIYHLSFSGDHEPSEMDVRIVMKRTVDNQKAHWQVSRTEPNYQAGS